jgi:hypothetical protein
MKKQNSRRRMITKMNVMRTTHPRWEAFLARLDGPEGCNFRVEDGRETWTCAGGESATSHLFSRKIMIAMGLTADKVTASLKYFREHGGYCDCDVVFNVGRP